MLDVVNTNRGPNSKLGGVGWIGSYISFSVFLHKGCILLTFICGWLLKMISMDEVFWVTPTFIHDDPTSNR